MFADTEQTARLLLKSGANPNAHGWERAPALKLAIGSGDIGLVRLLLDYGADPLLESPFGMPLDAAREFGTPEIVV